MIIAIINPFSSANYLSESFKQIGIKTIAIYTKNQAELWDYLAPKPEWFDQQIFLGNEDVDNIIHTLKNHNISYVINGCEISTHITDQIAQKLTPKTSNDPNTSSLRSDKYCMHNSLAINGLAHIKQIKFIIDIDNITDPRFSTLNYPCFIKPLNASSSLGALKINSYTALVNYFYSMDQAKFAANLNIFLQANGKITYLIGECIEGEEYFIDTFSYQGKHYISSIQQNVKKIIAGKPIYLYWEIVTNTSIITKLSNYIFKVLSALEFNNGFAHTEVFINHKNNEAVLIEVNSRVSGARGLCNYVAELEGLPSQIELLKKLALDKSSYTQHYAPNKPHPSVRCLVLYNFSYNPLPDLQEALATYTTIKQISYLKPIGHIHQKLPDLLSEAVAFIVCSSAEFKTLDRETRQILAKDHAGWK